MKKQFSQWTLSATNQERAEVRARHLREVLIYTIMQKIKVGALTT